MDEMYKRVLTIDASSNIIITNRHIVHTGGEIMRTNLRAARLEKG